MEYEKRIYLSVPPPAQEEDTMLFMRVAILILMGLADASVHFPDGPCFGGIAANPGISRGRALPGVWAGLGKFRGFYSN